ncbi:MAG TPA: Ig-like domain-containing protein, partial [Pirellulales bacterium]|nr:Ig-like domain-containing protein [Pirellulales bacterium]
MKANEAVRIKVESGKKYILNSEGDVGPENVTVTRAGNDLLVALEGSEQPSVVLEDYFAQAQPPGVYGIAEDGRLYEYTRTDGVPGIFSIEDGATEPVALGGDSLGEGAPYLAEGDDGNSFFFLPWLLGGLGLAALGGALYAANRDDDEPAQVAAPVVTGASDNVGPEQGALANGDTTDDSTPALTGTGTPGSVVTIYDDGKAIGSTTVDGNGSWTVTPSDPLTDGKHDLTAVTTDPDGNVSPPSPPFVVDVDTGTTPPPALVRPEPATDVAVVDDQGPVVGMVTNGQTTDDATPSRSRRRLTGGRPLARGGPGRRPCR